MAPWWLCAGALATSLVVLLQQVPSAAALKSVQGHQQGGLRAILVSERPRRRHKRSEDVKETSLFCFTVVRPGTPDVEMLKLHMSGKMLSGCDAYTVYSNVSLPELLGGDISSEDLQLFSPHEVPAVLGSMDVAREGWPPEQPRIWSASNTNVFMQAWNHVWQAGLYQKYDWTLKVDPDTLLIPDRMRMLLQGRTEKVALIDGNMKKSCPMDNGMGGIMALTSGMVDAMKKLHVGGDHLEDYVTREDGLVTAYCEHIDGCQKLEEPNFKRNGMVTENACRDSWKAAFHKFNSNSFMRNCLDLVRQSTAHPDRSQLHTNCL